MNPLRLATFDLHRAIGRGSVGEVWRAVHRPTGSRVAVKVIAWEGRTTEALRGFHNEIRAQARLDHPGIARVLDHGEVSDRDAQASRGHLARGCPFLVTELAELGTLSELRGRMSWEEVRRAIMTLLDALAHAHARGVLHRDLKPGNVLRARAADGALQLRLCDFGIARALGDHDERSDQYAMGTYAYMAPEQITGDWRDHGPWTDLYALGVVAWVLLCGRAPYQGGALQVLEDKLERDAPPLDPATPVPAGAQAWLDGLLVRDPLRRCASAADAAWGLARLEPPSAPPPLPASWGARRAGRSAPHPVRSAALLGLRTPPMVGRSGPRDQLWDALRAVHERRGPRAVLVTGSTGVGKKRLARWLCERAVEVGGASALHVTLAPGEPAGFGLQRALHRILRLVRVGDEGRERRVARVLARHGTADPRAVPAALALFEEGASLSAAARRTLELRVLRQLGSRRPLILHIEDPVHDVELLRLVRALLGARTRRPLRILALVTSADDDVRRGSECALALEALARRPDVLELPLAPLPRRAITSLLDGLLPLEPTLRASIVERSDGNPLFAVQLLQDLIARDAGLWRDGLWGRGDAAEALPAEVAVVWRARVEAVLAPHPAAAGWMLERAAVLGRHVDDAEWGRACRASARGEEARQRLFDVRAALVEALCAARLAERTDRGWTFRHGMVRATVLHRAKQGERWVAHHRACARVLRRASAPKERIGRHLLAAGAVDAAVPLLLSGAEQRAHTAGTDAALALLGEVERAMRGAVAADERSWVVLWLQRADLMRLAGLLEEAGRWAADAERAAARGGWADLQGEAVYLQGRMLGESGDARGTLRRALQILGPDGDPRLIGLCHAHLRLSTSDRAEARVHTDAALAALSRAGQPRDEASACRVLGHAAFSDGDLDEAWRRIERARHLLLELGETLDELACLCWLGEIARVRGDAERAQELLEEAVARQDALGLESMSERCNLALIELDRSDPARALAIAEDALSIEITEHPVWTTALRLLAATACAGLGRWRDSDRHLARFEAVRTRQRAPMLKDHAEVVDRLAVLAERAGEAARAEQARAIAQELRRRGIGP